MSAPVRIAMWSGPRNISTAMMRSFEARGDCAVVDEPFYAVYLARSGADHPMRAEVLASQPNEPDDVVAGLSAPLPAGKVVQYQKQMTHHMVFEPSTPWLASLRHAFLIRDPAAMIASYLAKRPSVVPEDLGLARQRELYTLATAATGHEPPVVDAADLLMNPPGLLRQLCAALGITFTDAMCRWPPGRRATDGVWAPHWYGVVEQTTGFAPYQPSEPSLPTSAAAVLRACEDDYQYLFERRLTAA